MANSESKHVIMINGNHRAEDDVLVKDPRPGFSLDEYVADAKTRWDHVLVDGEIV
jgi:hypothetical protein